MKKIILIISMTILLLVILTACTTGSAESEKTSFLDREFVGMDENFFIFEQDGEKIYTPNDNMTLAVVDGKVTFLIKSICEPDKVILFNGE